MLIKSHDSKYLKARYVDEKANIEVGIYPVLFGWRVLAGKIDNGFYELDYCCGAEPKMVATILSMIIAIINKHQSWKIFPIQYVKPVFNDIECFSKLVQLAGENFQIVEIPDLAILRKDITSSIFNEK